MKKLIDLGSFRHVAFIQTAFLGDVVLTLPVVQAVRNSYPRLQLSFVTTPSAAPLISCIEAVDNVISFDKRGLQSGYRGMKLIAEALAEKGVDCIITPHRSLRTSVTTYLAKPAFSVGFNRSTLSVLYKKRVSYNKRAHEIERNMSLLSPFSPLPGGNEISLSDVETEISADDKSYIESRLNWAGIKPGDSVACIAPGSVWETKRWKKEQFAELAMKLKEEGLKPVVIGSAGEKEVCGFVARQSSSADFSGETTIPQLLYLLQQSALTVTNDSAPTHLAGLAGCPVVTVFGPTSPIFGFAPVGKNDRVVYNKLKCSPCAIHGGKKCPIGTHECMSGTSAGQVLSVCRDALSGEKV